MKKQPTEGEKILINHIADKGLIFKMHYKLIKLNSTQTYKHNAI